MAKKIKDYYDFEYGKMLASKLRVFSIFDEGKYETYLHEHFDDFPYKQRIKIFSDALDASLNASYVEVVEVFLKILGPPLQQETGMFKEGWHLAPISYYVEIYGVDYPDVSLSFLEELTQRYTGEFAIRPILEKHPHITISKIENWTRHESVHVRRLAAESMRIGLPWAKKSLVCIRYFDDYEKILTNLSKEDSLFIKKSIGNNLNDLYKYDEKKAQYLIDKWLENEPTKDTLWIIKHGLRSLIKRK